MVPDLDLQLQAAIKALTDAVMPAVDPADKMANEQIGLAIATLAMVRSRLPLARRYARAELRDAIALADDIAAVADGAQRASLAAASTAGRDGLDDPAIDTAGLEELVRTLKSTISATLDSLDGATSTPAIEAIVLRHCKGDIDRGRAWCLPAGFEPEPQLVPSLESLLA